MDDEENQIWQDREIRFDISPSYLKLRRGEFDIDALDSIEDTKGNNGEKGSLYVTNLRMMWTSSRNPRINLSIGYNAVVNITIHGVQSRLRGHTQALYVLTKFNGSRFEFIFTNLVKNSPRLFTTVQAVFKSYESTRLYRDLKLRGAIIRDKELILLPDEQIYSRVNGVWNLSSEQGNLGSFYITNVRIVWFANLAENFNVSIPYPQIKAIGVRESKFGQALVIETLAASGGYVLGFRVDQPDRLNQVFKEMASLHKLFSQNPVFGVKASFEDRPAALEAVTVKRITDDVQIVDEGAESDAFAAYFAEGSKASDRPVVYSTELGLAVEKPRDGWTIDKLWSVL
eukprot:ANDGO_02897.mRNA.1 Bardet-Biedl syndrome 5 protein homolog